MDESYAPLLSNLKRAAHGFGTIEAASGPATTQAVRRSRRPIESRVIRLQLISVDGLLDWRAPASPRIPGPPRKRGTTRTGLGQLVAEAEFPRLPPSEVTAFLEKWDTRLSRQRGLRKWDSGKQSLESESSPAPQKGRALLIIHGTFSNGDNNFGAISSSPEGQSFLKNAEAKYDGQIYSFDHPTISVGPILNAIDLAVLFQNSKAEVDVISHSRGGLVARWFDQLHSSTPGIRKVVLVGSPLGGTSLASPPNLRKTIRLLTNLGHVAEKVTTLMSSAVPLLTIVGGLLTVVTSISSWTATTPVIDAVVAMVPGWFAQSRVGNNPELLRLLGSNIREPARYYFVISNFESPDPGWAFWKRFRTSSVTDFATDMIFPDLNDLVVDTKSMMNVALKKMKIPSSQVLDYKTSADVHHLNYFHQRKTIDFLSERLIG